MKRILFVVGLILIGIAFGSYAEKAKDKMPMVDYRILGQAYGKRFIHYQYINEMGCEFEVVAFRPGDGAGVSMVHSPTCTMCNDTTK